MAKKPKTAALEIVYSNPKDLKPDPRNARKHTKAHIEKLRASYRQFGWTNPILLRPNGMIGAGHGRHEMALAEKLDRVPTITLPGLTEKQWRALVVSDNQLGLASAWDSEKLAAELTALAGEGLDLTSLGFDALELGVLGIAGFTQEERNAAADETPEPPKKPVVAKGELWLLAKHRILCGDSTNAEDIKRLMADAKAQMVFTDPPYGVDYTGGMKKRERLADDHLGTDIYAAALPHLNFAADDKAPLYLWYADGHAAAAAAAAAGYIITAQIIWAKNHAQFMTSAHYKGKHEPCYYAHRRGKTARWHGPNNEVTLWEYDRSPRNDFHPTQKPVALAQRAINNSSKPGDLVLDLFLGGGTTVMAAETEGRIGFGMELAPAYVQVAIERWEKFTGKKAKREDGETLAELKKAAK